MLIRITLGVILTLSMIAACPALCSAQAPSPVPNDWPNFRGPDGNGVAPLSAKPPIEFGPDKNLKWKVAIPGDGHSSPIVWKDRIYLMTAVRQEGADGEAQSDESTQEQTGGADRGDRSGRGAGGRGGRGGGRGGRAAPTANYDFMVVCLNRENGETVWQKTVITAIPHESGHGTNTFASASPVTDGRMLWCNFGSQGVWCLDMSGEVVWSKNLGKMETRNDFGEGASVAVYGDTVVIPWDHESGSFILACNALTGEEIWKRERDEPTSWSTPVVVRHNDRVQVVTNGTNRIRSYDLATGDIIWECGGQTKNPIPTPLISDGVAYCMTGYQGYAIQAVSLDASGVADDSEGRKWSSSEAAPYIATGTMYEGTIYLTKGNSGILSAVDARTGETIMGPVRLPDISTMYASMVAANGNIYACGREGEVVVFPHGTEFTVTHRVNLGESIDATPAISGNQLFIRGARHLYCFENRE